VNPADRVEIERLSLRVTGMDPIDATALARAIAEGLAPALSLAPGEASLPRLAVQVQAKEGERTPELAARAVARLAPLVNPPAPGEGAP
jgi:hypothetical protein